MQDLKISLNGFNENTMTSLELSNVTKELHKNVLQNIRKRKLEFNGLKVQPVKYKDEKGEMRPMFILDMASVFTYLGRSENKMAPLLQLQLIEKFTRTDTQEQLMKNESDRMAIETANPIPHLNQSKHEKLMGWVDNGWLTHRENVTVRHIYEITETGAEFLIRVASKRTKHGRIELKFKK